MKQAWRCPLLEQIWSSKTMTCAVPDTQDVLSTYLEVYFGSFCHAFSCALGMRFRDFAIFLHSLFSPPLCGHSASMTTEEACCSRLCVLKGGKAQLLITGKPDDQSGLGPLSGKPLSDYGVQTRGRPKFDDAREPLSPKQTPRCLDGHVLRRDLHFHLRALGRLSRTHWAQISLSRHQQWKLFSQDGWAARERIGIDIAKPRHVCQGPKSSPQRPLPESLGLKGRVIPANIYRMFGIRRLGGGAAYLDSPIYYLPTDSLPRPHRGGGG